MTARVDLGRSRSQFAGFWAGMALPSENMHFHISEMLKNSIFHKKIQYFQNFPNSTSYGKPRILYTTHFKLVVRFLSHGVKNYNSGKVANLPEEAITVQNYVK